MSNRSTSERLTSILVSVDSVVPAPWIKEQTYVTRSCVTQHVLLLTLHFHILSHSSVLQQWKQNSGLTLLSTPLGLNAITRDSRRRNNRWSLFWASGAKSTASCVWKHEVIKWYVCKGQNNPYKLKNSIKAFKCDVNQKTIRIQITCGPNSSISRCSLWHHWRVCDPTTWCWMVDAAGRPTKVGGAKQLRAGLHSYLWSGVLYSSPSSPWRASPQDMQERSSHTWLEERNVSFNWSQTCFDSQVKDGETWLFFSHRQPPAASSGFQTFRSQCSPAESSYWCSCTLPELPRHEVTQLQVRHRFHTPVLWSCQQLHIFLLSIPLRTSGSCFCFHFSLQVFWTLLTLDVLLLVCLGPDVN